jgi:hypothetical protein
VTRSVAPAWQLFIAAALGLAIAAGLWLGGALLVVAAHHAPASQWGAAAAQAHGHVAVFGWAGLMVLGVGLHVLPRLRGAPLLHATWARGVLALLVLGLVSRALVQPLLSVVQQGTGHALLSVILVESGVAEAAGVSLLLWMLGATVRAGPPLRTRTGLWPILPLFVTAFLALWLALAVNLVGLVAAAGRGDGLVPDSLDDAVTWIGLYAFLVPVSVAMARGRTSRTGAASDRRRCPPRGPTLSGRYRVPWASGLAGLANCGGSVEVVLLGSSSTCVKVYDAQRTR